MKNLVAAMTSLAMAWLAVCAAAPASGQTPDRIDLASLSSDDYSDLTALKPLLEDAEIVQLGENSHGAGEYFELKARLVRYLHQELGFGVLVFESDFYQCARADTLIERLDREPFVTACAFGVWHTEEVARLFDYMRLTRGTDHPLRLSGHDVQPIGWLKRSRPEFLERIAGALDPDFAADLRTLDETFLAIYALNSGERRAALRERRDELVSAYADAVVWFDMNKAVLSEALEAPEEALIARQALASALQYIRQQTAPSNAAYAEARDWGMAENLEAIRALFPGEKIIIWAHNAHIRYANEALEPGEAQFIAARQAGHWIKQRHGQAVFTVGLFAQSGEMANNARQVAAVTPPPPGSLEAQPIGADAPARMFIAPAAEDALWDAPITAKYGGKQDITQTLRDQYDAVILLREVSPPEYLYEID